MTICNRRQACCAEILCKFNFQIVYSFGEKNGKADTLLHQVDPKLTREGQKQDFITQVFKPSQFDLGDSNELLVTRQVMDAKLLQTKKSSWLMEIFEAGLLDSDWSGIRNALVTVQSYNGLGHYRLEDDLVTYECRMHVPEKNGLQLKVAQQCHNAKVAGHLGRDKTVKLMNWNYYWANMEEWV